MKYRYFIIFQFNGRNYHGWQMQPNAVTVQKELNEKLGLILRSHIETVGAGRTDAGVHASYFAAHFDLPFDITHQCNKLSAKLDHFIANDITIKRIIPVNENAHARFDAISRTYKYYINLKKEVFTPELSWHVFCQLDINLMNEGAKLLKNYNDFTSFSRLHSDVKTYICKIKYAEWTEENGRLVFTITADRFLRNMVRAIVGTMVLLGRRKIDLTGLCQIIESKNRALAGESAPAHGLFLHHIEYPYPLQPSAV